jgi:hypothetical protein
MAGGSDAADAADNRANAVSGGKLCGLIRAAVEDDEDVARDARPSALQMVNRLPDAVQAFCDVVLFVAGRHDDCHMAQGCHTVSAHSR